jgi:DNA-binding beta-propeller fold protein YncE
MGASAPVAFTNGVLILTCEPIGTEICSGFSDGDDVIMISRREDNVTDKVGADGEMVVSISADKSGTIKIKLLQTSPTNKFLSRVHALQGAGPPTYFPLSALFQDANRQDIGTGLFGYVKKLPEINRGKGPNEHEWEMVFQRLDVLLGDPITRLV